MKKQLLVFLLLMPLLSAEATPSFKDADGWRRDFSKAQNDIGSVLIAGRDSYAPYGRKLSELRMRAERLFGKVEDNFGAEGLIDCSRAVAAYESAWESARTMMSSPNVAAASGQAKMAFEAGDRYRSCSVAVEELESPRKRK